MVIATGVSYRRLAVPGLEALTGAGVFYGPARPRPRRWRESRSFVVGGGNSAGQAALHLSKYARRVTIVVRSRVPRREHVRLPDPRDQERAQHRCPLPHRGAGGGGAGRLEYLELRDNGSGETAREPADGLFVLIGAEPLTGWLPDQVGRDQWGFILTGQDTGTRWPLRARPRSCWKPACPGCSRWATSAAAP